MNILYGKDCWYVFIAPEVEKQLLFYFNLKKNFMTFWQNLVQKMVIVLPLCTLVKLLFETNECNNDIQLGLNCDGV